VLIRGDCVQCEEDEKAASFHDCGVRARIPRRLFLIVMGIRDYVNPADGTRYTSLEANYGYAVGLTSAGLILSSSD